MRHHSWVLWVLWYVVCTQQQDLLCNSFTPLGLDFASYIVGAYHSYLGTNTPGILNDVFLLGCLNTAGSNATFCNRAADNKALYNLVYPQSQINPAWYAEYTLEINKVSPLLDFSSRMSFDTTTWFTIVFDASSLKCISGICNSAYFGLQPTLLKIPLTVASNSFISENINMAPDILFHDTFKTTVGTRFVRMPAMATGGAGNAAFWTNGCKTPRITIRVQYVLSEQQALGYSVQGNIRGVVACQRRVIYVMSVADSADVVGDTMICHMSAQLWSNTLRKYLRDPARGATDVDRRQNVLAMIKRETYAYTSTSSVNILYSTGHANALLDCAQPASPTAIGGTWKEFSSTTPGSCQPCTKLPLGNTHLRNRYCNHSLAKDIGLDCCFECTTGYMYPPKPASQAVCVKECKKNQQFDTGRGMCTACTKDTFSLGGAQGTCQTCNAAGFFNARVDSLRGCVTCDDARLVAQVDKCVPCPTTPEPTFVPLNNKGCFACSTLGAYYLPLTRPTVGACVACAAGTFMNYPQVTFCRACQSNTYSSGLAMSTCALCPVGTESTPNRTTCRPCPILSHLLTPYARYYESGCRVQCAKADSYQVSNPQSVGGCMSCHDVVLQAGTYTNLDVDCSKPIACTNAVGPGTFYTGSAHSNTCEFDCVAGYIRGGNGCVPCLSPPGYSAALHVFTSGCSFDCKPGLYRNGDKLCNKPCVELVNQHPSLIHSRVRDYGGGVLRPHYLAGVCGSADTSPRSDLPFLRTAWWAYLLDYTGSTCGNSLLETGEQCDDGNHNSGDGCTNLCKIETDQYWDCDLIGFPCLQNCGWLVQPPEQWGISLYGFLLPACSTNNCVCGTALSYYTVSTTDVGPKSVWMHANMASCDCKGNIQRSLPYEQCTLSNKGCRECPIGSYHDDLRAQCIECGKMCLAGYQKEPSLSVLRSKCLNVDFSTSTSLLFSVPLQQQSIGCSQCPVLDVVPPRYVGLDGKCSFVCYKDTTGETTDLDTYCSTTAQNGTGICPGRCKSCKQSLLDLTNAYYSNPTNRDFVSHYIDQCRDEKGHTWKLCDAASKPIYAEFSTASLVVGASTGCQWSCPANTYPKPHTCLPCASSVSCQSGQQALTCSSSGLKACVPCEGTTDPLKIWTTKPPYFDMCEADCEPGVSYSSVKGLQCYPCNHRVCVLGELFIACTSRTDATCTACPLAAQNSAEYITAGLCETRCTAGNYYSATMASCIPCSPNPACTSGQVQNSYCVDPLERKMPPTCSPCPNSILPGQVWSYVSTAPPCTVACAINTVMLNMTTCVPCSPALCGLGQMGQCLTSFQQQTTDINCQLCPSPLPNEMFIKAGTCDKACKPNYIRNEKELCVPLILPSSANNNDNNNVSSSAPALVYPIRKSQHSAMS